MKSQVNVEAPNEVLCCRPLQAVSSQQMQEARGEAAALHLQLANLKASQQQIQANQV